MSAYTGDIVKDGLTLYLDAANYKSFVSGSTTWYDLARPGFTGSLINGPAYTGSNKGAIIFDGSNDYVAIPTSSLFSSSQVTFALWNFGNSNTNIATSVIGFDNSSGIRTLNVHLPWLGDVMFDAGNGSGNSGGVFDRILKSVTAAEISGWNYWAFTKNSTAGTMRIYRNGELWHSGGGSAPVGASVTGSLGRGAGGSYHNGRIGMAKLYSRELSAAEIRENYNATKGRYDTTRSSDAIKPALSTSGLSFHIDAANYRSFVSGSSTWRDLSGNGINGTLTNGPTYSSANNGSIIFDGVDDYVTFSGTIVTSTATFLIWIYRNGDQAQYDGVFLSRGTNVTGLNFFSSNQLGYHWNDNANTYNWASGLIVPNLQWSLCAVSVGATSATAYLCQQTGITSAVNNVSHASTTLNNIQMGRDSGFGNRFFAGNISVAQIYNRALSRDEIVQYFNYTKGRYGYVL